MIEISFAKLVLLALVALIVLGPEKLPGAARTAGALLRRMRSGWDSVRSEVERELEVEEIRRAAREAAARAEAAQDDFRQSVGAVETAVKQAGNDMREAVAEPAPMELTSEPPPEPEPPAEPDPQQELPLAMPHAAGKGGAHGGA